MTNLRENIPAGASQFPGAAGKPLRWCLYFILLFLLFVEIVIGRTNLVWRLLPGSDMGTLLLTEELLIRPNPDPRVLIFGTSRGRGAFLPVPMEQVLGLRRGQVLNLSMGGGQIFDALVTYERNRALLSRAPLVVVQMDPFQLSLSVRPGFRFRNLASWSDRMAYSGATRARLLADVFYRTDNVIPHLSEYLRFWRQNGRAPQPPGMDPFGRLAFVRIADDHPEEAFTDAARLYWIDHFYREYEYSPVFEAQLVKLIRMVKEDGGQVVLIGMPTSENYWALLRARKGDLYGQFKERMTQLAAQWGVPCQFWDTPEEVGLTDRNFRDWGHLNTPGAVKWSEFFARWIQQTMPVDPAGHPGRNT